MKTFRNHALLICLITSIFFQASNASANFIVPTEKVVQGVKTITPAVVAEAERKAGEAAAREALNLALKSMATSAAWRATSYVWSRVGGAWVFRNAIRPAASFTGTAIWTVAKSPITWILLLTLPQCGHGCGEAMMEQDKFDRESALYNDRLWGYYATDKDFLAKFRPTAKKAIEIFYAKCKEKNIECPFLDPNQVYLSKGVGSTYSRVYSANKSQGYLELAADMLLDKSPEWAMASQIAEMVAYEVKDRQKVYNIGHDHTGYTGFRKFLKELDGYSQGEIARGFSKGLIGYYPDGTDFKKAYDQYTQTLDQKRRVEWANMNWDKIKDPKFDVVFRQTGVDFLRRKPALYFSSCEIPDIQNYFVDDIEPCQRITWDVLINQHLIDLTAINQALKVLPGQKREKGKSLLMALPYELGAAFASMVLSYAITAKFPWLVAPSKYVGATIKKIFFGGIYYYYTGKTIIAYAPEVAEVVALRTERGLPVDMNVFVALGNIETELANGNANLYDGKKVYLQALTDYGIPFADIQKGAAAFRQSLRTCENPEYDPAYPADVDLAIANCYAKK